MTQHELLSRINSPADLRSLPEEQLNEVCAEIRNFIIHSVADTGGHFASNLGTVELTVALHYVFNTPDDTIVWDTGHQAYTHKILTGRRDKFDTLRQFKGLSGFPTPEESPYDAYPVGHAGTSVSVALGMAKARDLKKEDTHVTAVIGDGALTSGLSLEALNNAHNARRFLLVLNDNEMSISPTIGALAKHFSKIVANPHYLQFKHGVGKVLTHTPLIGKLLIRFLMRLQGGIKHMLAPQNVFEQLGFHYIGPIDGHDVHELVSMLRDCQAEQDMPVLLHIITKKGKGFAPAESNPEKFHGVKPFDTKEDDGRQPVCSPDSSPKKKKAVTYTEMFSSIVSEFAEENENIVVISAAMCGGTGMTQIAEKYPSRFVDVGIAEQHAVTYAGGLAARGFRPIVAIYSTFLQRAYDEIAHDVCLPHVPVIFGIDRAGLVGSDGKTHHGVYDIAYLRHLPGMTIFMPRDEKAMRAVLTHAVNGNSPCAIRYPRRTVPDIDSPDSLPAFASDDVRVWDTLRTGDDVTLIALGHMVSFAMKTAELLAANGIQSTVIDACAIHPMDTETLKESAARTGFIVTLEDHVLSCGFGSLVAEYITQSENNIHARLLRIGIPDEFIEHGTLDELYTELGWQPEQLKERISSWLRSSSPQSTA